MSIRDWLLGHSFIDPVDVCQTYGHDFTMTSDDGPVSTWQCNDCDYRVTLITV